MPGGKFDSSKTRLAPFFDYLLGQDLTSESWLPKLLAEVHHGSGATPPARLGPLQEHGWGKNERALPPPADLLAWLIRNLKCPSSMKEDDLLPERKDLVRGDPSRIQAGLSLLSSSRGGRAWHILEGSSYPDAFLATSDSVVVIEGKRTEAGPTTSTTWMPVRHQMLRHLDGAYELAGHRSLWGFFMVEGSPDGSVPQKWVDACIQTLDHDVLEQSLPHRSQEERGLISKAFLGVITWQQACVSLGVPLSALPNEVDG